MKHNKRRLYVDLGPLVAEKRSGVGYSLSQLLQAIDRSSAFLEAYEIIGFVGFNRMAAARAIGLRRVTLKRLPLTQKMLSILFRMHALPPIDYLLGKGTYLFYDFRTLPLSHSSASLVCIHDLAYKKYPDTLEQKNLHYLSRIVPLSMRRADAVIAVSDSVARDIATEYPNMAHKVSVLYDTISDEYGLVSDEQERAIREKYELPGRPYLLHIGNLEPRKNVAAIIEAMRILGVDASPPLVLVGANSWRHGMIDQALNEMADEGYEIVRPQRYVTDRDLPGVIVNALCVITPSLYEGFGYPPLQALLCKVPALVSMGIPVAQIFGDRAFFVIPQDDYSGIARTIQGIMDKSLIKKPIPREEILAKVGYGATVDRLSELLAGVHTNG